MSGTLHAPWIAQLDELAAEASIRLEREVPMAPLTTLRVGGSADRMASPTTLDELLAVLRLAQDAEVPVFVLGKGSDIVVADDGIRGLVIRNRADAIDLQGTTVTADSGSAMALLVKRCTAAGLAGLEFGISIPGSLGGAVWADAGAHGGEMKDVVARVTVFDPGDGSVHELEADACAFAYRESRFKHSPEIILSAAMHLERGDPAAIADRVRGHQAERRATQPLADANAGSVFRNPPGDHAGRLIEAAGLKGHRIGSAQVSTVHANFIVTDPAGRAADVRALGDHVRSVVAERFGVTLDYEIEFVGDWMPSGSQGGPA
jgi:UDP-N-acetylmuramate dehydrogenase